MSRERLELTECSDSHYSRFGVTNFPQIEQAGFGKGACVADPAKAVLKGVKISSEFSFLEFNLEKCVPADLPAGQ